MKTRNVFGIAFLICFWQILFAFLLTPNLDIAARYDRFNEWDSNHYNRIIDQGYSMPEGRDWIRADIHSGAANVMFFPGYPLASRYFKVLTGIPTRLSMLIVAQLACWIFWVYFLLILLQAGATRRGLTLAVFLILIHPAAFYLVMGYTESTFLAALLGFIYWSKKWASESASMTPSKSTATLKLVVTWLAVVPHALVMGFTRIVSFAAAPYPTLIRYLSRRALLGTLAAMALGVIAICGTAFYFNFLRQRFGDWTLYFKLEEVGWGNHRQWLAVINPLSYIPRFFFEDTRSSINRLSNLSVVVFFAYLWKQEKNRTDWPKRLGLYFTAFFLYYIPITGKAAADMDSMVRYNLPSTVLLALCLGMITTEQAFVNPATGKIRWGRAFGAFLIFAIQVSNIYRFLRGGWIA